MTPARVIGGALLVLMLAGSAAAQPPQPAERVSFAEAIARAIERNPSSAIAAAAILRADALLTQAQSAARLQVSGNVATTTLNRGVMFEGQTVTPQNQVAAGLDVRMPIYAPVVWARRVQARDEKDVAQLSADNVRRQTALAAADAYLTILALKRLVEGNIRARDTAREHFDLARELESQGGGSRVNMLRAQQELSADEVIVEGAQLRLYQAQEALGVLLVADAAVDSTDEPVFALPPGADVTPAPAGLLLQRADLKLFAAEEKAATRVVDDSRKDYYPYLEGIVQGTTLYPAQFFSPSNSSRLLFQLSVPLFDSGQRKGQRAERQAALDVASATLAGATTQASSEVRAARVAVDSADRAVTSARAGADQARQVVDIVNISFRVGGATNIEVIDAERRGRDSDNAVTVAEDTLRRARLDLLAALGLFP